ncbi:hypothetical protein [Aquabacter sp. CN5-332]|uniref:hypothetical protein n=1 Tax=Aquabacter sp. CN5-332 TaxID=3156608 RepID=UPI0032B60F30
MIYAQSVAALAAGYEVDPDPHGDYAGDLGQHHFHRAERALRRIARQPVATALGLEAKARVIPLIVTRHLAVLSLEEAELIRRFAEEVRADLERARASADTWA